MESSGIRYVERRFQRILEDFGNACDGIIPVDKKQSPLEFAAIEISFERDNSAAYDKFDISLSPYLKAPLEAWDFEGYRREVVVMGIEQTGKSLTWIIGLLRSMKYEPCLSLVIYPSDELGIRINQQKLEPLMRCIPKLAAELDLPHSKRKDSYKFSNLTCYFQGAGSRITSHSARIRINDEIDDWIDYEGRVAGIEDVRKRARSFNDSIMYTVCTPTTETGKINTEFKKSSMGYWHLRCQYCGKLSIRSADVHNLQWALDEEGNIKPETLTLVCPECKSEHKEHQKRQINLEGGYVHKFPALIKTNPGFQWGALASQFPSLDWLTIAKAQMLAGKSGSYQDQAYFDNSIRGLPFHRRETNDSSINKLKQHIYPGEILLDDMEAFFYSGDTQDDCTYDIIGAIDKNSNIYILEAEKKKTIEDIRPKVTTPFKDNYKLVSAIQDEGGHRADEVRVLVDSIQGFWTYKGDNRITKRTERSKERTNHLKVKEFHFRTELLYYLYGQEKKDNNYLYFADSLPEDFYIQVAAYQPDNSKKNGNAYENWDHNGRQHDYFDCLKMLYALIEFVKLNYPSSVWRKRQGSWIPKTQESQSKPQVKQKTSGFSATNWRR